MSFLGSLTTGDFADAIAREYPRGRAFPRDYDTTLATLNAGLADAIFTVHAADVQMLEIEADPAYTLQLLPDWETDYGLPDPCSPAGSTLNQRRSALLAKIAATPGGQSIAYFVQVAAAMGYAITITEFRPFWLGVNHCGDLLLGTSWIFAWQVNAPQITARYFDLGISALGEPFWSVDNTELECRLRALAPAHTVLLFNYS